MARHVTYAWCEFAMAKMSSLEVSSMVRGFRSTLLEILLTSSFAANIDDDGIDWKRGPSGFGSFSFNLKYLLQKRHRNSNVFRLIEMHVLKFSWFKFRGWNKIRENLENFPPSKLTRYTVYIC